MKTKDLGHKHFENGTDFPSDADPVSMAADSAGIQRLEAHTGKPMRAVWAAGAIVAAWLLLLIFQSIFGPFTVFSASSLFIAVAALIGTAAYLVSCHNLKFRLVGIGAGVVAAIFGAFSNAITRNVRVYGARVSIGELFNLRDVVVFKSFGGVLLGVALALAAAWLITSVASSGGARKPARLAGLCAAAAYLGYGLISSYLKIITVIDRMDPTAIVSSFFGAFADAVCVFLTCVAVFGLCSMRNERLKLTGVGLVWAWLAAAGMAVSLAAAVGAGITKGSAITYTLQFILSLSGLTGYILLLCKRPAGLYVILLGVGAMLGAQLEMSVMLALRGGGLLLLMQGKCLALYDELFVKITDFCLTADRRRAIIGARAKGGRSGVSVLELATGRVVHMLQGKLPLSVRLSPDERHVLTDDGYWELETEQCLATPFYLHGQPRTNSNGSRVLAVNEHALKVYYIDRVYSFPGFADWDEGALPYAERFMALHAAWTEKELERFLEELQNRGYGYIRPEGVRAKLKELAAAGKPSKKALGLFGKSK